MAIFMNSTTLIQDVKLRAMIPTDQSTFTDDSILMLANDEIDAKVLPTVMDVKEEFYVRTEDITLVPGTNRYKIPYRAVGSKIRNIKYVDLGKSVFPPIPRIEPENAEYYSPFANSAGTNTPIAFYIENDDIVLTPLNQGGGYLRVSYYMRPNDLVVSTRVSTVTGFNLITGVISVDQVPTNITAGSEADFIEAVPNHRIRQYDKVVGSINVAAKTITFNPSDIPKDLAIGDYVCTSGETYVPQIPSDLHPLIAQATVCRILEALGDQAGLKAATNKLQEMENKALSIIDTRSEGSPQKVVNMASSLLRRNKFLRWYR